MGGAVRRHAGTCLRPDGNAVRRGVGRAGVRGTGSGNRHAAGGLRWRRIDRGIAGGDQGRVRIVGVEPEKAPTLYRALEAGRPVDAEAGGIAADSLAPKRAGELMFPLAQRWVTRVALVSDEAIVAAQRALGRTLP